MLSVCSFWDHTRGCLHGGELRWWCGYFGAPIELQYFPLLIARAHDQSARGLHVSRGYSRDNTELTMGKPEVNSTFIPSLIHFYLRNSARVLQEDYVFGS